MEWKQDAQVVDSLTTLLLNQKDDLGKFLETLHQYNDGSPFFAFLQVYGMFVFRFFDHHEKHTEIDAIDLTLADVANHPTVQQMVASMMQQQIDKGLNL
jgi:hypothetical protein